MSLTRLSTVALPRQKPRRLWISLAYLAKRVSERVVRRSWLLGIALDTAWLARRFAHELAVSEFGEAYLSSNAQALTLETLRRFVTTDTTVVDVGCGQGRWARALAPFAKSVVGVDYDRAAIAVATRSNTAPNVTFECGDVRQVLGTRTFDVAILSHVLEHLDDVDAILATVRSIARTVIVEVPDIESDPLNAIRLTLGRPVYWDADHVREYSRDGLLRDVERNGWRPVLVERNHGCLLVVAERA